MRFMMKYLMKNLDKIKLYMRKKKDVLSPIKIKRLNNNLRQKYVNIYNLKMMPYRKKFKT